MISTPLWNPDWLTRRAVHRALQEWGLDQRGRILDLGCGAQDLGEYFGGADSFIRFDRRPLGGVVGDAVRLPFKERAFDGILMFQVLGDIPQPADLMGELSRTLKEGGRVVIFETMCYPQHDLPHDYFRVMPQGLRVLAESARFEVAEIRHLGGLFTRFASLWNHYILNSIKRIWIFNWLVPVLIALSNLIFFAADWIFHRPFLSESYMALLSRRGRPGA